MAGAARKARRTRRETGAPPTFVPHRDRNCRRSQGWPRAATVRRRGRATLQIALRSPRREQCPICQQRRPARIWRKVLVKIAIPSRAKELLAEGTRSERDRDWIEDGEKFALIGLSVRVEQNPNRINLPSGVIVLPDAAFDLPAHWREWLGTTRSEVVERCPLFLLVKMSSEAPTIINHENEDLHHKVATFYRGLVLSKKFNAEKRPFLALGGRSSGDIEVRSFRELERPAGAS